MRLTKTVSNIIAACACVSVTPVCREPGAALVCVRSRVALFDPSAVLHV